MKKKLFLFDLDGSLALASDTSKMHDNNLKMLDKLRANGHIVSICTGRAENGVQTFLEAMKVKGPFISYTGSLIKDEDGKTIYEHTLPYSEFKEEADKIFAKNGIEGHTIFFLKDQEIYFDTEKENIKKIGFWDDEFINKHSVDSISADTDVHKLIFIPHLEHKDKTIDIMKKRPEDDFVSVFWPIKVDERYAFEFESAEISKWKGAQKLMKHYNIDVEDAFMLGDSRNDISIMNGLKHTFAPSNAEDSVKKIVKHNLKSSNEDGAVTEMLEIIEKEGIQIWK